MKISHINNNLNILSSPLKKNTNSFTYNKKNEVKNCLYTDTVSFTAKQQKENLSNVIANAEINDKPRFSPEEKIMLNRKLKIFNTPIPTKKILKELLDMEYKTTKGRREKLNLIDITNFIDLTNGANRNQIEGITNLIKYSLDKRITTNGQELDKKIFSPITSSPNFLEQIGKIEQKYKKLSPEERGFLISSVKDIVETSNYQLQNLSLDIAKTIQNSKNSIPYLILLEGADLSDLVNFKSVLKSLTPKKLKQIESDLQKINLDLDKELYISDYVESFKFRKNHK